MLMVNIDCAYDDKLADQLTKYLCGLNYNAKEEQSIVIVDDNVPEKTLREFLIYIKKTRIFHNSFYIRYYDFIQKAINKRYAMCGFWRHIRKTGNNPIKHSKVDLNKLKNHKRARISVKNYPRCHKTSWNL